MRSYPSLRNNTAKTVEKGSGIWRTLPVKAVTDPRGENDSLRSWAPADDTLTEI